MVLSVLLHFGRRGHIASQLEKGESEPMRRKTIPSAILLLITAPAWAAPTTGDLCKSAMQMASAKYVYCRLNAESKDTKNPDPTKLADSLTKCSQKLSTSFTEATAKYGAACTATQPSSTFLTYLDQCVADTTAATGGAALPNYAAELAACEACGNGTIDAGEACDGSNLNGQTCATQGFAVGTLGCTSGCSLDTSACSADPCSAYVGCSTCTSDSTCGWCSSSGRCLQGTSSASLDGTCAGISWDWNGVCSAP